MNEVRPSFNVSRLRNSYTTYKIYFSDYPCSVVLAFNTTDMKCQQLTMVMVCVNVCVCILAVHGFTSQTQFSKSSACLHYSYKSEPVDKVTPRQYTWCIKVLSTNIASDTLTVADILAQTLLVHSHMHCTCNMTRPAWVTAGGWTTRSNQRETQRVAGGHEGKMT